ncbi:hypothetical protein BI091_gp02 [Enterococcus phage SANTOR1]|nr:hypothetical protein BI091_gp02 [Enterococcus phage SANTOR1]ANT40981.1 hypothetical protein SANTOR1_0010 [Enterococcus phage SANTOR1]AXC33973.1 putative membrane protein [Enterococcus phage vB_EfaS_LM99]UMO76622.1 hypothetical protein [Enterococcus phage phiSHEF11]
MQNPVWLVVIFYVLGMLSLVTAMFFTGLVSGLVALSVALLIPAVILYKELGEGE